MIPSAYFCAGGVFYVPQDCNARMVHGDAWIGGDDRTQCRVVAGLYRRRPGPGVYGTFHGPEEMKGISLSAAE